MKFWYTYLSDVIPWNKSLCVLPVMSHYLFFPQVPIMVEFETGIDTPGQRRGMARQMRLSNLLMINMPKTKEAKEDYGVCTPQSGHTGIQVERASLPGKDESLETKDLQAYNISTRVSEVGKPQIQKKTRPKPSSGKLAKNLLGYAALISMQNFVCCADLKLTDQKLPKNCVAKLKDRFDLAFDCPHRDSLWPEDWNNFNEWCCGAYKGSKFHCIENINSSHHGAEYGTAACLMERDVLEGHKADIGINKTGYPKLIISQCPPGEYRLGNTTSTYIEKGYCFPKSRGNSETQELLCDSGEAADADQFICRVGYQPSPHYRHNKVCELLNCTTGQRASRNFTVQSPVPYCQNQSVTQEDVWFGCVPDLPTSSPKPFSTFSTNPTPSGQTTSTTPSPPPGNSNETVVASVVPIVVILILIACGCLIYGYCRKDSGSYNAAGGKLVDESEVSEEALEFINEL